MKRARSSVTGKFVTLLFALKNRATTVIETVRGKK